MSTASTNTPSYDGSEIAICGMAGRFPGAASLREFWRNLKNGVDSISRFTEAQLLAAGADPQEIGESDYVPARAVLEGAELFDAAFFGLTPREAEMLDPQQRLMLECAWEALEHAGVDSQRFPGAVGVFAGVSFSNYLVHNLYKNRPVMESFGDFESTLSNVCDSLATRVAYKLDLKGPCLSVQTFCSTSLVAVHLACQALLNMECDLALAGGVTVYVPQCSGYRYQAGGIVSPDGRCRPFSSDAAGTVFGNGIGLVVLRRLEDALAGGDFIHAIIRGSAVNNDGSLKVSYAAPGVVGQSDVVREALAAAGVDPSTVQYIEAHGTGTRLGDPAEVRALNRAFGRARGPGSCWIGSVKGNVGHLDAAAGVCGLIKTALALQHREIPASLYAERTNPEIDFASGPFRVAAQLQPWPNVGGPRRAGVSAFGIGGTNAHVVLEEAPPRQPAEPHADPGPHLLLLSARTPTALQRAGRNLAEHLQHHPDLPLGDVAYTLQVGRRAFAHRRAVVCRNAREAIDALPADEPGGVLTARVEQHNPPWVLVCGAEDASAAVALARALEHEAVFREHAARCAALFSAQAGGAARATGAGSAGHAQGARPAGRDQAGRDQAGRDQAGSDQAGRDDAGSDQAARDQAGSDQAGRDEAASPERVAAHGAQPAGPDQADRIHQAGGPAGPAHAHRLQQTGGPAGRAAQAHRIQQTGRFAGPGGSAPDAQALAEAAALFTVQYALARLYLSWGIRPAAVIGTGVGELVAACLAGALSEEQAVQCIVHRPVPPPATQTAGAAPGASPPSAQAVQAAPGLAHTTPQPMHIAPQSVHSAAQPMHAAPPPMHTVPAAHTESGVVHANSGQPHAATGTAQTNPGQPHAAAGAAQTARPDLEADGTAPIPWMSARSARWAHDDPGALAHCGSTGDADKLDQALAHLAEHTAQLFLDLGAGERVSAALHPARPAAAACAVIASMPGSAKDPAGEGPVRAAARLWLSGVPLNWQAFHAGAGRRRSRIPLPTYPFERQRYWVDPLKEPTREERLLQKLPDVDYWLYHPEWRTALQPAAASEGAGRFVLFIDRGGAALTIADHLRTAGAAVVTVRIGTSFAGSAAAGYTMDPREPDHYHLLVQALGRERHTGETTLAHFWSLGELHGGDFAARFADARAMGFDSLRHLARALKDHHDPLILKVAASGLHDVLGAEALQPEKAPLLAACKVMAQEFPQIRCCCIDLDPPPADAGAAGDWARRAADELRASIQHTTVAWRGARRWVETFDMIRAGDGPENLLRPRGVYLMTGGLGEVGSVLAACLARRVQARLVLTARSELPAESRWGDLLRDGTDPAVRRIRKVQALRDLGAEVWTTAADVADPAAMRRVVAETRRRFGALHGVIHAAGVLSADTFRPLRELDEAACAAQFGPKVHGLLALEQALQESTPDFCMVVSSLSSVLGGLGYAAYAAANAFMDAFAAERNRRGARRWISVNWDQWQFEAPSADGASGPINKSDLARMALSPQEGAAVFDRVLSLPGADRIIVSTANLHARVARWVLNLAAAPSGQQPAAAATARHARPPELEASYVPPVSDMERGLAEIWQESLGVDRVGTQDNFFDLGGHSLLTIQVIEKVRQRLGVQIKVEDFIFQTLGQMAAACEQQGGGAAPAPAKPRAKPGLLGAVKQALTGREERRS